MSNGISPVWQPKPVMQSPGTESGSSADTPTFVVGIGMSAGGLQPLETFFRCIPQHTGMAFVIIQHLNPNAQSHLPTILSQQTSMPIQQAEHDQPLQPNHVYVIPPGKLLKVKQGKLLLEEPDQQKFMLPIDDFFQSLAMEKKSRAIGMILSGMGSDGMRGVRAIKEAGGMVMVQSPSEAQFDGMPRCAISTGMADFILAIEQIPSALWAYVQNPHFIQSDPEGALTERDLDALKRIIQQVRKHTTANFSQYKLATILRRIQRRMLILKMRNLEEYSTLLIRSAEEANTLHKELLIGVTKFFRDKDAFDLIRQTVIPDIFLRNKGDSPIRIWISGCSTGEEAYSLAMLIQEFMQIKMINREVKIFATDIDTHALDVATEGVYPASVVGDIDPERVQRFFEHHGDNYRVKAKLRDMIIFAKHNLLEESPFTNVDLISCRNLLIYIQPKMKEKILEQMAYALKPNGLLILGPSESLGASNIYYQKISRNWKIFRQNPEQVPFNAIPQAPAALLHEGGVEDITLQMARRSIPKTLTDTAFAQPLPKGIFATDLEKPVSNNVAPKSETPTPADSEESHDLSDLDFIDTVTAPAKPTATAMPVQATGSGVSIRQVSVSAEGIEFTAPQQEAIPAEPELSTASPVEAQSYKREMVLFHAMRTAMEASKTGCVILNNHLKVLDVFGPLRGIMPVAKAQHDIHNILDAELAILLKTSLQRCLRQKTAVQYDKVFVQTLGHRIHLQCEPIIKPKTNEVVLLLALFRHMPEEKA